MIPQDVIDRVLSAHDIVEVVGRYVQLKPAGRSFKALCPFHEEKTPSFTVNPDRQTFKCFGGCGKGGSVFTFLMEQEHLTFPEAVRQLAKERGIEVPDGGRPTDPERESRVERVHEALDFARRFFRHHLGEPGGAEARRYLAQRGYDDAAVARFGLGYAPASWDALLTAAAKRRISAEALDEAGLVLKRRERDGHYDRFRHRVIFPLADVRGRVVSFGARALDPDDQPKYLNGPETIVFKKAHVLYALDRARDAIRDKGEVLLMEGYTDVLMCHLHGHENAVAGMGTAFTPEQARLLRRFTERVVLVYDADDAGRRAAERTLDLLLPVGLEVSVLLLPEGRDVDEILLEEGEEAFAALLADRLDLLAFKLRVAGARHDLSSPHGRARAAEEVAATVALVPSPVERDQLFREAAERLGAGEGPLRRHAAQTVAAASAPRRAGPEGEPRSRSRGSGEGPGRHPEGPDRAEPPSRAERVRVRTARRAEQDLLAAVVLEPTLRPLVLRSVAPEDFAVDAHRRVYNAVLAMEQSGESLDPRALVARLADDSEAGAVVAGLGALGEPGVAGATTSADASATGDGVLLAALEESVPTHIRHLESLRRTERRHREMRERLLAVDSPTETEPAPESRDPDIYPEPPEPPEPLEPLEGSSGPPSALEPHR